MIRWVGFTPDETREATVGARRHVLGAATGCEIIVLHCLLPYGWCHTDIIIRICFTPDEPRKACPRRRMCCGTCSPQKLSARGDHRPNGLEHKGFAHPGRVCHPAALCEPLQPFDAGFLAFCICPGMPSASSD
jgi:hypothetical protein